MKETKTAGAAVAPEKNTDAAHDHERAYDHAGQPARCGHKLPGPEGRHAHDDHAKHDANRHGSEERHHHDHHGERKSAGTVLTVRATSGLSGDMMLAGLAGIAGLGAREVAALVGELKLPALEGCLTVEQRSVNHIAGLGCRIALPHEHAHRTLADIRKIITGSAMPDVTKELSIRAFTILAEAEAAVHGTKTDAVSFHEVGALDSILDTCICCRIFTLMHPDRFICSPLPLADGVIQCTHGLVPSPAPAVLRLLNGVRVCGFPSRGETVTPTALSLLKALDAEFGPWPPMRVERTVISYGSKVFPDAPNGAVWAFGR